LPGRATAGLATAGLATAGLATAGLATAGLATAGLATAGLATAGLATAGRATAGRAIAGFTVPAVAEPIEGALATRAFLVVFKELIKDFFWMVISLLLVDFSSVLFRTSDLVARSVPTHRAPCSNA
jgi:hypothetical protein